MFTIVNNSKELLEAYRQEENGNMTELKKGLAAKTIQGLSLSWIVSVSNVSRRI